MKKILLSAFATLAAVIQLSAQCTPRVFNPATDGDTTSVLDLNIVTDFCANPGDAVSDHDAFVAAATFIRERKGHCRLYIPDGGYVVGKQINYPATSNGSFAQGETVLNLSGCRNVTINGAGAELIYESGFKFGYFDPLTGFPLATVGSSDINDVSKQASSGICINISSSQNITINGLHLDGNCYNGNIVKGGVPSGGLQLIHIGIRITNSGNIFINDCTSKTFGLDGLYINNFVNRPNEKNIVIDNCTFDLNSRQGISVVQGDSIKILKSKFFNTRQGYIQASPGAGVDLEVQYTQGITNVFIDSCIFDNNFNGIICTGPSTIEAGNIQVTNTTIIASTYRTYTYAVKIKEFKNVLFRDCDFYGIVRNGGNNNLSDASEGPKFIKCNFTDCTRERQVYETVGDTVICTKITDTITHNPDDLYIYRGINQAYTLIDSCTFEVYQRSRKIWNIANQSDKESIVSNSIIKQIPYINAANIMIDNDLTMENNLYFYSSGQPVNHASPNWLGYNTITNWSVSDPAPSCVPDTSACEYEYSERPLHSGDLLREGLVDIIIYPNPTLNGWNVKYGLYNSRPVLLSIYDLSGKLIKFQRLQGQKGENNYYISTSELASGMYFIEVKDNEGSKRYKAVKQ